MSGNWKVIMSSSVELKRILNDCRKTSTKVITPTNHNRSKQQLPEKVSSKRGKNRVYKLALVLVLLLIG